MSRATASSRIKKWPFYLLASIAIILLLLPVAARFGAQYALTELGAEQARIDDVDINLFTGKLAVTGLHVEYQQKTTLAFDYLALDISLLALFKKQILLEELTLSGLQLAVFQQHDDWVIGIPLAKNTQNQQQDVVETAEPSEWGFGIAQLTLNKLAINATYQQQDYALRFNSIDLHNLFMWQSDENTPLVINSQINGAPLTIKATLKPFTKNQHYHIQLALQDLSLSPLQSFLPKDIQQLDAKLTINTLLDIALNENGDLAINQEGDIGVVLDNFTTPELSASADLLQWRGKTAITLNNNQQPVIHAKGIVQLNQLNANYLPLAIQTQLAQFHWQGDAAISLADIDNSLAVSGDIQLDNWHLIDNQQHGELINFAQLTLDTLVIKTLQNITLKQSELSKLQVFVTEQSTTAQLANFTLQQLAMNDLHHLSIDNISINDIGTTLTLTQSGQLEEVDDWIQSLQQRLASQESKTTQADTTTAESTETAETPAFSYEIQQITVKSNSAISLHDNSVKPAVTHKIQLSDITLGKIQSSNPSFATPINARLGLYQHGSFVVLGSATLLQQPKYMDGDLTATIKGIELPDLSAYIENTMGYQANSGQFNSDSKIAIKQGQLDSETKVKIQRIALTPSNPDIIAKASQSLAMPVSTALKIITDKDNTLKLTVPVKGDLTDPNINVSRIMAGAITQAVKNTAVTYFKYAVQPFGAILLVSEAISDARLQARFEDVRFEPGTTSIIKAQKGYLAKVADMIKQKKDFSIVSCVVVTDKDFLARKNPPTANEKGLYSWDEDSKNLAELRLDLIRSTLINEHGLNADQIQACKPTIGKGEPRAIMGI